jgi:hypothetical protein
MIAAVVSSIFNMAKLDAARPRIMITAVVLTIFDMTNILLVEFVGSFLLNCGSVFAVPFIAGIIRECASVLPNCGCLKLRYIN